MGAIIPDFPEYTLDEYYYQMMLKNVDLIQTFIEEDEANDASYLYMYPYSNSIKELREIEAFTNELVSSATDDLEITNAIFDYLRTNITYDSSASIFFPAETLKAKKGVCYQYATLMHDMLTTQGIISFEVNCYTRFGLPYENAKQAAACQEIASNRHMLLAVLLNNQILYYDPTWGTNYGTDYRNVSTQYYVYGVTDVTYKLDDIDLSYMLVDNIYAMPMWIKNEICTIYQGHYVGGGTSSSHNGVMIDNSKERNKNDGQYNYGIKDYGPLGYAYRSCVSIYQVMSGQVYRADGNYFSLDSFIQFAQYMGKSMDEIVGLIKEWIDIDYIDDYLISHFYGENYIFGYYGTESNLIIPSTIGDYPIKSIYPNSFNNNSYLETVTISEGIKNIFAGAFSNCDNLREVSFPSSATYIGGRDPVTGGMNYSQMIPCDNCFNLERFIVSENNQRYKSYNDCLYTKDGKTLMSVPCKKANIDLTGTETIDEYAFKNSSIKEIVVPSSVTNIRHRAFACAFDLESIVFDCDGAEMGVDVFAFCYKLEHVTLEGVNTIGAQDFYHCVLLKEIIIPEGVTTIGNEAFCGSGLYSITLPSTLETIGEDLFYACYQLVEINNHSSLDILSSAGLEEESLNRVTDPSGHIIKDNDFVFYKSDTVCELIAYLGEDEIVCLPDQCEGIIYTISKYAFYNAFEDDSMTFSKDLGRRTYYVFDNRITNIKELYIPSCIATSYSSIFLRAEIFIQTT